MLIKHNNEEVFNKFIEEYKDFGKEYEEEISKYEKEKDYLQKDKNIKDLSQDDFYATILAATKLTLIYDGLKKRIDSVLSQFTQEMLIRIVAESISVNKILAEVCHAKLIENSVSIDHLNNYYKSGRIFGYLNEISEEQKNRLLELRETNEDIDLGLSVKIFSLSEELKKLIRKSLTSDLREELEEFLKENNITNLTDFEIHKIVTENEKIMNNSKTFEDYVDSKMGEGRGKIFTESDKKRLQKINFTISPKNM